jgi:hypothetical protein
MKLSMLLINSDPESPILARDGEAHVAAAGKSGLLSVAKL